MAELTKIEAGLLYGLKQFNMPATEAAAISVYLTEDEQILMMYYLASHPQATHQEIMNEFGELLQQRKRLNESSES